MEKGRQRELLRKNETHEEHDPIIVETNDVDHDELALFRQLRE